MGNPPEVQQLLREGRELVKRRNAIVHACVFAGGRVVSSMPGVTEWRTSAEELSSLADSIFTWKEHLSAYRWKILEQVLVGLERRRSVP